MTELDAMASFSKGEGEMKKMLLLVGIVVPVTFVVGISYAQRDLAPSAPKQLRAFVTAELTVVDDTDSYTGNVIRFEDSEYKVVCYMQTKNSALSCVKR